MDSKSLITIAKVIRFLSIIGIIAGLIALIALVSLALDGTLGDIQSDSESLPQDGSAMMMIGILAFLFAVVGVVVLIFLIPIINVVPCVLYLIACNFLIKNLKLPTAEQLQSKTKYLLVKILFATMAVIHLLLFILYICVEWFSLTFISIATFNAVVFVLLQIYTSKLSNGSAE